MKIYINSNTSTVEIKDDLESHYFLLKFMLILNILNGFLNLYHLTNAQMEFFGFIWILLGSFSIGVLIYLLLKKTTAKSIDVGQIEGLREKSFLGRKTLSIQLKSGKTRDLQTSRKAKEITEVKTRFKELGLPIC